MSPILPIKRCLDSQISEYIRRGNPLKAWIKIVREDLDLKIIIGPWEDCAAWRAITHVVDSKSSTMPGIRYDDDDEDINMLVFTVCVKWVKRAFKSANPSLKFKI